ncbi:hypothetical protein [Natronomonas sp.]|uniref:hypothetical protein n=1 Tax=Natronomonas sp. TaxID=2184060 RepID=UPI003975D170
MRAVWFLAGIAANGGFVARSGLTRRRERQTITVRETTDALAVTPGAREVYRTAEPIDDGAMITPFPEAEWLFTEWVIEGWNTSGKHSS